jgi:hypothetical protein
VWHPVGELPAAVYWRRRLVVLLVLVAVLTGAGWLAFALATDRLAGSDSVPAAPASTTHVVGTPALARVVPSLTALRTPTPPPPPKTSHPSPRPTAAVPATAPGGPVRTR